MVQQIGTPEMQEQLALGNCAISVIANLWSEFVKRVDSSPV